MFFSSVLFCSLLFSSVLPLSICRRRFCLLEADSFCSYPFSSSNSLRLTHCLLAALFITENCITMHNYQQFQSNSYQIYPTRTIQFPYALLCLHRSGDFCLSSMH